MLRSNLDLANGHRSGEPSIERLPLLRLHLIEGAATIMLVDLVLGHQGDFVPTGRGGGWASRTARGHQGSQRHLALSGTRPGRGRLAAITRRSNGSRGGLGTASVLARLAPVGIEKMGHASGVTTVSRRDQELLTDQAADRV